MDTIELTSQGVDTVADDAPLYYIGIDAGSKTVKLVVEDEEGNTVYKTYKRHLSNIKETLRELVHNLYWIKGDLRARFAVTGSAGISISDLLGIPFIQEVMATTQAVQDRFPETDAVIELGGEDAKVMYLTGGVEQRMNSTCAGGTGGFIDTIAYMLGTRTAYFSGLSMGAQQVYPIASRCAVFAQTDVRPLMNEGASKADIAASVLEAVVRQTLGGLACGRPIKGNVLFLGGPFEYIPDLVRRFRLALGLDSTAGRKPENAHLFPAYGAAGYARKLADGTAAVPAADGGTTAASEPISLSEMEAILKDDALELAANDLPRLEPLFASEEDLERFRERHSRCTFPFGNLFSAEGPLYLGIDCGSTTVKLALLDEDGNLLYSDYQPSRGETADTVRNMLISLYASIPHTALEGHTVPYIAHATATGYGENMLIEGFQVDSGTVETAAHAKAALQLCPDATFLLDIGGQDMKALWLEDGAIADAVLNEACSSGCGAFVDGTAYSLHSTQHAFATEALSAKSPVDLGTRCTVFMSSRVKHAQKVGATRADIAAGVAYSVVQNVLYRIIGQDRIGTLGDRIVVQGGTFKSDAVLRAFEKLTGVEVLRPDRAHLMGAIGAAFIAKERAAAAREAGVEPKSGLVVREDLTDLTFDRTKAPCVGCANHCMLSVMTFSNGNTLISGNKCDRARVADRPAEAPGRGAAARDGSEAHTQPNLIELEQNLLAAYADVPGDDARADVPVGLVTTLAMYEKLPFWHTLFSQLGFAVKVPETVQSDKELARAAETVPADGICFPAKLSHAKAFNLMGKDAAVLFFPRAERAGECAVTRGYATSLADSVEDIRNGKYRLVSPEFSDSDPRLICANGADRAVLREVLAELCEQTGAPLTEPEFDAALEAAVGAQRSFEAALADATQAVLTGLEEDPAARAIVLVGRPYHNDERMVHGIDRMLTGMGFPVLSEAGLRAVLEMSEDEASADSPWRHANPYLELARFAVGNPQVELVFLQSFGCGYDAVNLDVARAYLESHGKTFTALKIDEMVETAHIRIRLRTLAETLAGAGAEAQGAAGEDFAGAAAAPSVTVAEAAESAGSAQAVSSGLSDGAPEGKAIRVLDMPMTEEDLRLARNAAIKDVCFAANALAARAVRAMRDDDDVTELVLPEVCKECLCEAIPVMAERTLGETELPAFVWEQEYVAQTAGADGGADDAKVPVGVIGNASVVYERSMNDDIEALLDKIGCRAVYPEDGSLFVEDVRYLDQLQKFADAGITQVIYLQSFGCLKGNLHARGSRNSLAEQFPDMNIAVIDLDPEASALNRENRIRLVAEAAIKEAAERRIA